MSVLEEVEEGWEVKVCDHGSWPHMLPKPGLKKTVARGTCPCIIPKVGVQDIQRALAGMEST